VFDVYTSPKIHENFHRFTVSTILGNIKQKATSIHTAASDWTSWRVRACNTEAFTSSKRGSKRVRNSYMYTQR